MNKESNMHLNWGLLVAVLLINVTTSYQTKGETKETRDINLLIAELKDSDPNVRESAAKALGQINDSRAIVALVHLAYKEQGAYREQSKSAIEAIGQIQSSNPFEFFKATIVLMDDSDENVRKLFQTAFEMVEPNQSEPNQIVLDFMTTLALTGKYPDSRVIAVKWVRDQMVLSRIAIEDKDYVVRQTAEKRVDPKILYKVRENIATAIANLASISDSNQLVQVATTDSWKDVRRAAVEKLVNRATPPEKTNWLLTGSKEEAERLDYQIALSRVVNLAKDWDIVKLAFNNITNISVLEKLAGEAPDKAVRLAAQVRLGHEDWNNATRKASQGELATGDVIGAIALFPQNNTIAVIVDELCLSYIRKGDISRISELIELINDYGTVTLAEDYLNCGQSDLDYAARQWAGKHGYKISPGSGSHCASWGSSKEKSNH